MVDEKALAEVIAAELDIAEMVLTDPLTLRRLKAERIARAVVAYLSPGSTGETEGWVLVPKEPTPELLHSMAVRYDHGLGVPGYYDQPVFGAENVGHAKRLDSTIRTMRQLHEEVVGTGFYRAPSAMLSAAGER